MLGRLGFTGRIMAIVLLALFAMVAISAGLSYVARNRDPGDTTAMLLPERAAAIVEVLEHTPPGRRETALNALNSESLMVSFRSGPPPPDLRLERLPFIERAIAPYFAEVGGRKVIAALPPYAARAGS